MKRRLLLFLILLLVASNALATNYYVRTDGNNSNTGLANTSGAAWLTVGKCAATIAAGDTCNVAAGSYDERVTLSTNGSSGSRITYLGAAGAKILGFDGGADYTTVQGFEMTESGLTADGSRLVDMNGADYFYLIGNTIHDTSLPCVRVQNASNVIIRSNTIYLCGEYNGAIGISPTGLNVTITAGVNDTIKYTVQGGGSNTKIIAPGTYTSAGTLAGAVSTAVGVTALVNPGGDNGDGGNVFLASTTVGPTSAFVLQTVATNAYTALGWTVGAGVMVSQAPAIQLYTACTDCLIERNTVYRVSDYVTSATSTRAVIRGNVFGPPDANNNMHIDGFQCSNTDTFILVEGNEFRGNTPDNHLQLCQEATDKNLLFRYNWTYQNNGGIDCTRGGTSPSTPGLYYYNNTLVNNASYIGSGNVQVNCNGGGSNNFARNNILYSATHVGDNPYLGTISKDYDLWYMGGDPSESNDINADPLLTSVSGGNFALLGGSPAIDAGRFLTTANGAGSSSTSLTLNDPAPFQDGWAGASPDCIAVGSVSNTACIVAGSINYSTGAVTLGTALTWSNGASIWLYKKSDGTRVLYGGAPDIGAFESNTPSAALYVSKITIPAAKCGVSDLIDFPYAFLTANRAHDVIPATTIFKTVAYGGKVQNPNGYDIIFWTSAAMSTKMDFNLTYYNGTTGEVVAWVRIPNCSSTTGATLWVSYDDASIISYQGNDTGTWNSNFKRVYHFEGDPPVGTDTTANGAELVNSNVTSAGGDPLYNGTDAKFNTGAGTLTIPAAAGTISVWWKPFSGFGSIDTCAFCSYDATGPKLFDVHPYSDGKIYAGWYNAGNDDRVVWTESMVDPAIWHNLTVTWTNGGTTELFVDGVSKATSASLNATWDTTSKSTSLGWNEGANAYAHTILDEVQLSDVVRSDAWILAAYNNLNDPESFSILSIDPLINLTDSFDHYTDVEQKWTLTLGGDGSPCMGTPYQPVITSAAAKTGIAGWRSASCVQQFVNTSGIYKAPGTTATTFTVEFDMRPITWTTETDLNLNLPGLLFSAMSSGQPRVSLRVGGTPHAMPGVLTDVGKLCIYTGYSSGGTLIDCTAADFLALNSWYHIKATIKVSTSTGYIIVWVNGTQVFNETSLNTGSGNYEYAGFSEVVPASGATFYDGGIFQFDLDNVILYQQASAETAPLNYVINAVVPNSNGATVDWTRGGVNSGFNFSQVNAIPPDTASYNFSQTQNQDDLYAFPNIQESRVFAVVLWPFVKAVTGTPTFQGAFHRMTTVLTGTDLTPSTSAYTYMPIIVQSDPFTTGPWSRPLAVSDQKGIELTSSGADDIRLAQYAVEYVGTAFTSSSQATIFIVQ